MTKASPIADQTAAASTPQGARPEWARRAASSSRSAPACWSTARAASSTPPGSTSLAEDVADLAKAGKQVIVVSSGAIALGRHVLGLPRARWSWSSRRPPPPSARSRSPAPTRPHFKAHGLTAAQILLTLGDTEERRRYLNARQTIATLLAQRAVPVVNENDTVATTRDPLRRQRPPVRARRQHDERRLPGAALRHRRPLHRAARQRRRPPQRLDEVRHITPEIEAMAGSAGTELSRGGMVTKIEAGKIALASGTNMVIASGKVLHPAARARPRARPAPGSWPPPIRSRRASAGSPASSSPRGIVDDRRRRREGAAVRQEPAAGRRDKRVEGTFERGDAVVIRAADGRELGRGLVAYARADAARIIGKKSGEIAAILGYRGPRRADPPRRHGAEQDLMMAATSKRKAADPTSMPTSCTALGQQAREAARALALASTKAKNAALLAAAEELRRQTPAIIDANARDLDAARAAKRPALLPRPPDARPQAHRRRSPRAWRTSPRCPIRSAACWPTGRGPTASQIERVRVPLGVDRHHLREPAERDGRRRRAVPQGRQCRDPARRLGQPPFEPRHPGCLAARPARSRPARGGHPARAHHRPRRRGPDAGRPRRRHRRDRAARRQKPGRARAGGGARAGVRAPGRPVPHLRRPQRRPRDGQDASSSTPRCAAPACAAPPRRCWSIATPPQACCRR